MSLWPAQLSLSVSSPCRWEFEDAQDLASYGGAHNTMGYPWNTPRMLDDDFERTNSPARRRSATGGNFGDELSLPSFGQDCAPAISSKTVDPMMLHDYRGFASAMNDDFFHDGNTSFTPFTGSRREQHVRGREHNVAMSAAPATTAYGFFGLEDEQEEDDESEIEFSNYFAPVAATTTTTTTTTASSRHCDDYNALFSPSAKPMNVNTVMAAADDDDDDDDDYDEDRENDEDYRRRGRRRNNKAGGDEDYKEDDDDDDDEYRPSSYPLKRGTRRRKPRAGDDDDNYVDDEESTSTTRTATARTRRKRAVSLKRTDAPSCKVSSRVFALYLLFAGRLPSRRPEFVPVADWDELQLRAPTPERAGSLIEITDMSDKAVTVRFPVNYDLIVHSRANYGPELAEHTESIKTRFRWWSDCALLELTPIRNRCSDGSCIDRSVTLPAELLATKRIRALWRQRDSVALCAELSSFFIELLKAYLHPDDRDSLDREGFGRTRRKPQSWPQHRNAFELVLNQFIERNQSL
jgi:hypothetical protein